MRLTCPNCDARYAVSAAMIPRAGREVECSACGHVWFFRPDTAGADTAPPAPPSTTGPAAPPAAGPKPEAATGAAPGISADDPAPANPAGDAAPADPDDAPAPDTAGTPAAAEIPPAHERVDPSVLGVLREEAARESAARRGDGASDGAAPLVTPGPAQPRAPFLGEPPRPRAAAGTAPDAPAEEQRPESAEAALMRRVRSRAEADAATTPEPPARRSGARRGFAAGLGLVIVVAAIGALVYAGADEIAATWPAAAEPLAAYVAAVDGAHGWIAARAGEAGAALGDFVAGLGD